jgi:hypothetical protein
MTKFGNNIIEYISIGLLLLLIIKLLYDSYKISHSNKIINKFKKMFRPYKSWFTLEDNITENDSGYSEYSGYSGYSEYSENTENNKNETEENNTILLKKGYPYTEQGQPINLDKNLKKLLNNEEYDENDENDSYLNTNNDNYMKCQLNFNDKINGTSKDAPDMVDKLNQYVMNGGVSNPTKIQDVYDKLTASPY